MRLGIDFGTTRTVVAAADRGNYPILSFEVPDGTAADWFPSVIAVRGSQWLYGWDAWMRQGEPDWTLVRSVKRLLEDAGPHTVLRIGNESIVLLHLLREMAGALRESLLENAGLRPAAGEKLEIMLGVPANSNTNQRFMTAQAFRDAGFDVIGLLNEPSAASIEFGHRNRAAGCILVYDLGGGTFDASLVDVDEGVHEVIASEGISSLGGDDFDHILADLALAAAGDVSADDLSTGELFRLNEECRRKKEALHPNTRRINIDLEYVCSSEGVSIPVNDYYARCRPLVEQTVEAVKALLSENAKREVDALYITGGGSELPLVGRMLKEEFGRRVRRSAYARSATAIGLAIQADQRSGYTLREQFTRNFGVWREADAGNTITFDPLFAKGTLLPLAGAPPLRITRAYSPAHNVGHFRYLECSRLNAEGQPAGDITVWDEILFPLDPSLREHTDLSRIAVRRADSLSEQRVVESYTCDESGAVVVTIANKTANYSREYRLGRWASSESAPIAQKTQRQRAKTQAG